VSHPGRGAGLLSEVGAVPDRHDWQSRGILRVLDAQLLLVFLVAIVARILYFAAVRNEPYYQTPLLDAAWYHQSALDILRKSFWGTEVFFRGPFYSYFLAFFYRLFGDDPEGPKIAQMVIGAVTCALLTATVRRFFDRRTALLSGLVAGLYPLWTYFDGELLDTSLFTSLSVLLLYLALRADECPTWLRWGAAGLVLGLASITRPQALLFGAGLGAYLLAKRNLRSTLLPLAAGALLVIAPVTLRNAAVGHDFVPIASQGGINFYMGNHAGADGKSAYLPGWSGSPRDWSTFEYDTRRMAETEAGHRLTASGESAFWTRKALGDLVNDPVGAAALFGRKVYYLLNGFEVPNNRNLYFVKRFAPTLHVTLWKKGLAFPAGLLIPLAVVGLVVTLRDRKRLVLPYLYLGCQSAAVLLFFVCERFRVPLLPVLIPFAVAGARELVRRTREGPRASLVAPLAVLAVMLGVSNSNLFGVTSVSAWQDPYDLGLVYAQRGQFDRAQSFFEDALRLKGDEVSVLYNLGLVHMELGNLDAAVRYFREALAFDPRMLQARNNLGIALARTGRIDEAEAEFRAILEVDPQHPEALANLRRIDEIRGGRNR
jgi:4-amino-4-deoxy-L-arabinose transferase-like glycosyltransferase